MTEFVTCYIEGKAYPRATCHQHHKNPRHAGGSDSPDNLVWLCANAHQLVHRAAQMIKAKKSGHANDLAMSAYPLPSIRQRFLEIVSAEVLSSEVAEDAGKGRAFIVVEVPIPKEDYVRLKLKVSDQRAGGKKVSISDYVARLVLAHLRKSG